MRQFRYALTVSVALLILGPVETTRVLAQKSSLPPCATNTPVYGEDEGFVRGRRFLHPKLGFTFQAPENFKLDNTAQAVIGVREGGSQAVRRRCASMPCACRPSNRSATI